MKELQLPAARPGKCRDRSVAIVGRLAELGVTLPLAREGAALVGEVDDLDRIEVVEKPEVVVEPLLARQERLVEPEVPLADAGARIPVGSKELGDGELGGMEAEL